MKLSRVFFAFGLSLTLYGCFSTITGLFDSSSSSSPPASTTVGEYSVVIDETEVVLVDKKSYTSLNLQLRVQAKKSLYFIFTNTSSSSTVDKGSYSVSSDNFSFSTNVSSSVLEANVSKYKFTSPNLPAPPKLLKGSANNTIFASTLRSSVSEGDADNFYEVSGTSQTLESTCRRVVSDVSTDNGNKTLNIWVADNCWHANNGSITQEMVDSMANIFLKEGSDNDIYDWVTNICGEEWGSSGYSNMLSSGQPIDILLCDIENDGDNGNTLGYFWSGNNSTTEENSNQRIMFYMDAPIYASAEGTWSVTGPNQREQFTTLAHEFQHMINYYQNTIKNDVEQETWLDELLAMSMEDLVAYKLYGDYNSSPYSSRFTEFNGCNFNSLGVWSSTGTVSYAMHYGFGSYLLRQYGGAKFVKRIYDSKKKSTDAVEAVTSESFPTIMRYWGSAYLLSDQGLSNGYFAYNSFLTSTLNSMVYKLCPINAFSISPVPTIYVIGNLQNVNPRANVYYKIADNLAVGNYNIKVVLGSNLELTIVAK